MRLERISAKNIRKHPSRVFLLLTGLVVAVTTVVSLYTLSAIMRRDFQDKLDTYGSNMVIVPRDKNLPTSYSGVSVANPGEKPPVLHNDDIDKLLGIRNAESLAHVAPKLIQADTVRGRRVMVAGVRFKEEYGIKKWWRVSTGKKAMKADEVLLGAGAARRLDATTGQRLSLGGSEFKVTGILDEVGSQEDNLMYIDLATAQRVYGRPGELSIIEVSAWCYNCPIEQIVGQATEELPNAKVSAVLQASQSRNKVVDQFSLFAKVLSAVMIVVASLIVTTSLLSNVRERRREIGIFRAVGFRRVNILEIILVEAMIMAFVAGALGYVLGVFASHAVAPSLGLQARLGIDVNVAYFAVLGTLVLSMLASLYPALAAAGMNPAEAINDI